MQTTEVNPPRAAAAVPVAMVSLADCPGSRKCTCKSINPGQTTSPFTSTPLGSGRRLRRRLAPHRRDLAAAINTSAAASSLLAGSITRPPASNMESASPMA